MTEQDKKSADPREFWIKLPSTWPYVLEGQQSMESLKRAFDVDHHHMLQVVDSESYAELQSKLAEQAAEIERLHEKYDFQALVKRDEAQKERIAELENEKSELIEFHHFGKCENKIDQLTEQNSILREGLEFIKDGCIVPPDGGSPEHPKDCMNAAREALEKADKVKGGM